MTVGGNDLSELLSVIMIIGFEKAGEIVDGTGSILGGGTPVSRSKGTSSRPVAVDRALIGGASFGGGWKAFFPNPRPGFLGVGGVGGRVLLDRGWGNLFFFSFGYSCSYYGV